MRLWHLVTLTSPAFFRSPRGRWAVKFMSTFAFLGMYMAVLSSYQVGRGDKGGGCRYQPQLGGGRRGLCGLLQTQLTVGVRCS